MMTFFSIATSANHKAVAGYELHLMSEKRLLIGILFNDQWLFCPLLITCKNSSRLNADQARQNAVLDLDQTYLTNTLLPDPSSKPIFSFEVRVSKKRTRGESTTCAPYICIYV